MVDQFALAGDYGIVGAIEPKPMYYTYLMYKQFGSAQVRAASDDDLVRVYAAERTDGALTILIVNLASTAQTKPLTILGAGSGGAAETWLFDEGHKAEKVANTQLGGTVTLSAESVTVLVIPK
jgi:hypothetical protein